MRHLLVTNDFPPKIGGIQSYLWELWRRMPADTFAVMTPRYCGDRSFDAEQKFRVERINTPFFLPLPALRKRIDSFASEVDASFVVVDPSLLVGGVAPKLQHPYVVVGHGAEFVIPDRIPFVRHFLRGVTRQASGLIGGGAYVTDAMSRTVHGRCCRGIRGCCAASSVPTVSIPPGVDTKRFVPLDADKRNRFRDQLGIARDAQLVLGVSRLVARKGFARLVRAAARLRVGRPDLVVAIAGRGRQDRYLRGLIKELDAPVKMLGRVDDADLAGLYGAADVFCMPCHERWSGLEQEGFGIVFAEAAAAGVPSVAGASGGSSEAVIDGKTGYVVQGSVSVEAITSSLAVLLDDPDLRREMGEAARQHAVEYLDYDHLASDLTRFLQDDVKTRPAVRTLGSRS